jgi:hypothetical protein
MKRYEGHYGDGDYPVWVDGQPLGLRLDLANKSPTGFAWGYLGSGPAQLALALLADCVGDELALKHYQTFKERVVAQLPAPWTLTSEGIAQAVETCECEARDETD